MAHLREGESRVEKEKSSTSSGEEATTAPAISILQESGDLDVKMECTDRTKNQTQLDEVLVEALRVPRDRIFVLRQEKDMEDRIRNGEEQVWELPLMNSYQRLLVHRIADHFHLAHSIDATTKAVTLTRQQDTGIPELSLSTLAMADMERLSEPAYAISRDSSAGSFKIMRREGVERLDSMRNGNQSSASGLAKDRRNMTIEEREAAYKEARLRIFGSEEACVETVSDLALNAGEAEAKAFANLSLSGESSASSNVESQKGTPGRLSPAPSSTSSTSSAAFLRAGAPSFDPNMRGTPMEHHWQSNYTYPVVDANGILCYPHPGGFGWSPYLQHDANGRQMVPPGQTPLSLPHYPISTPGSSGSNQDVYSSIGHSPSVSSRSTSISAGTEGEGGQILASRTIFPDHSNPSMTSPASMQRGGPNNNFQPGGGSNGSNGSNNNNNTFGSGPALVNYPYQGQVPIPASWNYYSPPATNYGNSGRSHISPPYNGVVSEDGGGRNQANQRSGYAAALANTSRGGPLAPSSSSSQSSGSAPGYLSPLASSSSRVEDVYQNSQGRSRNSPTDRFLFDPNKPAHSTSSSSSSNNGGQSQVGAGRAEGNGSRHSLSKSSSAGASLETRPNSTNGNHLNLTNPSVERRISSPSNSPTDAIRKATPPSHPSLPARPDWAMPQKNRSVNDTNSEELNKGANTTTLS